MVEEEEVVLQVVVERPHQFAEELDEVYAGEKIAHLLEKSVARPLQYRCERLV